ncbi:hypothetical protein DLAC_10859 [Tieghemostelium lacteum]|uniref:PQ loop repeat protein n=1 Tax=Tieghemostelium lacteum TaxID=361077 RepID=A0A151Z436_TIELA|nr:hypothetical protein DLAC_10859 [Tieghemostelium lacteum]|eukprot:KYQ88677.1 hypothetical protein DLAC_10859 [Tieghemostelium lacteum]
MENKVLSNLFGIAGTIIWSVQLIPQIRLNYQRQSTKGVSLLCFSSWYICGLILSTYLIFSRQTPSLIIQITLFSIFCAIIVFQSLFYERKYPLKKLMFTVGSCLIVSITLAIGIYEMMNVLKGHDSLALISAILSSSFMIIGFFPQIYEIYQSKSSEGLSKIFVVMDFFGGVASILSLVFHVPFDYLAFATYLIVPIFQCIIFGMILYYSKYYAYRITKKNRQEDDIELDINELSPPSELDEDGYYLEDDGFGSNESQSNKSANASILI